MPTATIDLPNGGQVTIEGSSEEIKDLLNHYSGASGVSDAVKNKSQRLSKPEGSPDGEALDLSEIVNLVKTCDEAEQIETKILDKSSQIDRTLLPLYIVYKHMDNAFGLTSGDINLVTTDLGVPLDQAAASRTLSGTASRYVIGDKVRKKGVAVHYKLSRRGANYLEGVLGV